SPPPPEALAAALSLPAPRQSRDRRPKGCRRRFRLRPPQRTARLVALGPHTRLFPDRLPQPLGGNAGLALGLRDLPARRASHYGRQPMTPGGELLSSTHLRYFCGVGPFSSERP